MISLQYISRLCLIYLLITLISWLIFIVNNYYKTPVKNEDCHYKANDLGDATLVFHGFSVVILTFITFNIIIAWGSFQDLSEGNLIEIIDKTKIGTLVCHLLYFVSSVFFFYEWMIEIKEGECKTESSITYSTFGKIFYLWAFFGTTLIISYFLIKNFLILIFSLVKDANIFLICKGTKQIKNSGNNKEIQTDTIVLIPLIEKKENIILKCMICIENPVDLIFDCNHSCMCSSCYKHLEKKECPYCRKKITNIKTIFLCGEKIEEKIEEKINLPNIPLENNINRDSNEINSESEINIGTE